VTPEENRKYLLSLAREAGFYRGTLKAVLDSMKKTHDHYIIEKIPLEKIKSIIKKFENNEI
jgi:hypothetical protein